MAVGNQIKQIVSVVFLLIGLLLVVGNLIGNLGFTVGTLAYNESQEVMEDTTSATTNISDQFGTVFTLLGVVLILVAVGFMLKSLGVFGGKKKGMFG